MGKRVDLAGKRIGHLVVLRRGSQDRWKRFKWLCRCDCGAEKEIHGRHLSNGVVKTCGCGMGREYAKPALGMTGPLHPKWKGGRYITNDGYVMVYQGPGQYVFEHRLVAQVSDPSLVVHHQNHDKTDNRACNLAPMTRSEHAKEHSLGAAVGNGRRDGYLTKAAEALEEGACR